jgi:hypothetical protein
MPSFASLRMTTLRYKNASLRMTTLRYKNAALRMTTLRYKNRFAQDDNAAL